MKQLKLKLENVIESLSLITFFKYSVLVTIVFVYALSLINTDLPLTASNTVTVQSKSSIATP